MTHARIKVSIPMNAPGIQKLFSTKRSQGSLKRELIPGLMREKYKATLKEHFVVPENKEGLKRKKQRGTNEWPI